jgi:hypothetical protein
MREGLLADLASAVRGGNAVVIVGTGVSAACAEPARATSWIGLLEDGAKWCEDHLPEIDESWVDLVTRQIRSNRMESLLQAADSITSALGGRRGGDYSRWLRESIGMLRVKDPRIPQAIASLEVPIITTNYDQLLEDATGRRPVTWEEPNIVQRVLRREDDAVVHLHGFWSRAESVVLGRLHYHELLGDQPTQAFERAIFSVYTVILVGIGQGASDPDFMALREWFGKALQQSELPILRLCLDGEVQQLLQEHRGERIRPVAYGASHEELLPLLQSLATPAPGIVTSPSATAATLSGPLLAATVLSATVASHPPPLQIHDTAEPQLDPGEEASSKDSDIPARGSGSELDGLLMMRPVTMSVDDDDDIFLVSTTPVTQQLWAAVMADEPSRFVGLSHPVDSVSWRSALEFCNRLSEMLGFGPAFEFHPSYVTVDLSATGFRLPAEREWVEACGRGYRAAENPDVGALAWYSGNAESETKPVRGKDENEHGLFDMLGNVREWCLDRYTRDQTGELDGPWDDHRVLKGGSFSDLPKCVTPEFRFHAEAKSRERTNGFRVVRRGSSIS